MIQRGCGFPIAGGIYLKVDVANYGTPWQYFIYDPPIPVYDPESMGISAQGISFIEDGDHFNIFDWVGAMHYQFVPCFVEEGLRLGFSRRIPKTADFKKLTRNSRHILLHKLGLIVDPAPYYKNRMDHSCPNKKEHPEHLTEDPWMCFELLKESMDYGKPVKDRKIEFKMPSFTFQAWQSPEGVVPTFQLAAFMWLPVHHLEVVYDDKGGAHESALKLLKNAGSEIPYEVADYGEEVEYDRTTQPVADQ